MDEQAVYDKWIKLATEDADVVSELSAIAGDSDAIKDASTAT